jgi:tetratricopeptide (TPR) repeat protein
MRFQRRVVVFAAAASLVAGWLVAQGTHTTSLPGALKEIQEGVQRLSQEVKALQAQVKELASLSKHGAIPLQPGTALSVQPRSDLERAREAYVRGSGLEKQKLCQAAVEAYTEAIRVDPLNDAAFLHRGLCYLQLDATENALADLNQALTLQPNSSRAYATRAVIETRIGQSTKALLDFNEALDRDPQYAEGRLLRGELYQQAGQPDKAIEDFTGAISAAPDAEKAYLKRSEVLRSTGQWQSALADCEQALRINPRSAAGFLCRTEFDLRAGATERAIANLNRAALAEDSPPIRLMVSTAGAILNDRLAASRPAEPKLETALRPGPPPSQSPPAEIKPPGPPSGPPQESVLPPLITFPTLVIPTPAEPAASHEPRLEPRAATSPKPPHDPSAKNAREYDRLGRRAAESGKLEEALVALTRAVELDPKLASAYNARGYVYLRLRRPPQALLDFSAAIRLNPSYPNAYHNRAVTRRLLGDSEGAAQDDRIFNQIMQHLQTSGRIAGPPANLHP